jgi:hypothetical protein
LFAVPQRFFCRSAAFLFVNPQRLSCSSIRSFFCLSFRSAAEESAFALSLLLPFSCHPSAKREDLLFVFLIFTVLPDRKPSFRPKPLTHL